MGRLLVNYQIFMHLRLQQYYTGQHTTKKNLNGEFIKFFAKTFRNVLSPSLSSLQYRKSYLNYFLLWALNLRSRFVTKADFLALKPFTYKINVKNQMQADKKIK